MSYQIGAIDNTTNAVENILHNFQKKRLLASGTTLILSNPSSKSLIQEGNERLRGSALTLLEHFLKKAIGGRHSLHQSYKVVCFWHNARS